MKFSTSAIFLAARLVVSQAVDQCRNETRHNEGITVASAMNNVHAGMLSLSGAIARYNGGDASSIHIACNHLVGTLDDYTNHISTLSPISTAEAQGLRPTTQYLKDASSMLFTGLDAKQSAFADSKQCTPTWTVVSSLGNATHNCLSAAMSKFPTEAAANGTAVMKDIDQGFNSSSAKLMSCRTDGDVKLATNATIIRAGGAGTVGGNNSSKAVASSAVGHHIPWLGALPLAFASAMLL